MSYSFADEVSYPMSRATAFAVLYARHCIWPWEATQSMAYDRLVLDNACRAGIVFG
jgi:hypothetical protein